MILVPLKPVVLVLGLLSGLIFVGFLGIVSTRRQRALRDGQSPNEAHACKAGNCTSNSGAQASSETESSRTFLIPRGDDPQPSVTWKRYG
jgi:hypothetical protein